jgi:hypothetical protein
MVQRKASGLGGVITIMTQFIRVRPKDAARDSQDTGQMCSRLESIPGITATEEGGEVFVVDANDENSAGGLADELFNRIFNHEPVEAAPLVRLMRLVAENGWVLEAWYSDEDADLPTFSDADAVIRELLVQASAQPPEPYVRLLPPASASKPS